MQFLSMIRINENSAQKPDERLMTDMGKLMEEMMSAGILIDTAGLRPTSEGKRVRLSHGRTSQVDGPFTETKEVIGGYAILEVGSMDEALEVTRRFLDVHGTSWEIECEVRQMERHPQVDAP
ncbi:MAG: YciI family protein [Rhodanobacter sp.]